MSKSNEFKNKIGELNGKIQELKTNFFDKYFKINKTIQLNKRIDDKLEKLKNLQNSELITIKSINTSFKLPKKTLEDCMYFNLIQSEMLAYPMNNEFFVEYTEDIVKAIIEIIQVFQKDKPEVQMLNIEVSNNSKKENIISAIESYFPQHYNEIFSKTVFFCGGKTLYGIFGEDVRFDPTKKGNDITLSNDNKTATHNQNTSHNTVVGHKDYSEGIISWKVKCDSKGDTNWLCVGIMENYNGLLFLDNQTSQYGINVRGGAYSCNNMTPDRIPNLEVGDVLTCTLDFDADVFTVSCPEKFEAKSTKPIKGKKWYPSVILYYPNQGVTIVHE